jgi:hypothetical protein
MATLKKPSGAAGRFFHSEPAIAAFFPVKKTTTLRRQRSYIEMFHSSTDKGQAQDRLPAASVRLSTCR